MGKRKQAAKDSSRILRKQMTDAEVLIWSKIRRKQLGGLTFRRQHPIGPYIADFYCPAKQLVLEIDGASHADRQIHDQQRTAFMKQKGLTVVRYWNSEVMKHMDGVLNDLRWKLGLEKEG